MISASQLTKALIQFGIAPGDALIVHSSYKAIGAVAGGPDAVVTALLDTIGPGGHLMMPTFTYSAPVFKEQPFHSSRSISRTGIVSEMLRLRADAKRSFHPTHSVVVYGHDAEKLTERHLNYTPMGVGSPISRMVDRDAKILLLGTGQETNSTIHYCECVLQVPYLRIPYSETGEVYDQGWFVNESDHVKSVDLHEMPGCSKGFSRLEDELITSGTSHRGTIANANCQLLQAQALKSFIAGKLTLKMDSLLCINPECRICPRRRRLLENLGRNNPSNLNITHL